MCRNGRTQTRPRRPRSDLSRRLGQHAATAAALRHRPRRACLQDLGIPVVHANDNVGANLQDHVGINYTFKAKAADAQPDAAAVVGQAARRHAISPAAQRPAVAVSMNNAGGFFRTDPSQTRPNMQLYFQAFSTVIPKSGERPILTPDPWPGFSIGLSNCRPTSRGSIMIRSSDPRDYPKIVPNAFSTDGRRRRDARRR